VSGSSGDAAYRAYKRLVNAETAERTGHQERPTRGLIQPGATREGKRPAAKPAPMPPPLPKPKQRTSTPGAQAQPNRTRTYGAK
jgi:hypothetical protein